MREILFRGKLTDDSKWGYGCLLDKIYGAVPAIMSQQSVDDAFNLEFEYDHVQEKTVGQYTGMKDKNGKRIFEGDIVTGLFSFGMEIKAVVVFQDGAFGLQWIRGGAEQFSAFTSICNVEFEVIGNIHDNPELLKEA